MSEYVGVHTHYKKWPGLTSRLPLGDKLPFGKRCALPKRGALLKKLHSMLEGFYVLWTERVDLATRVWELKDSLGDQESWDS